MADAGGFENNTISVSLLDKRGVSVELGANPCLRKGSTTIMIHDPREIRAVLCRPVPPRNIRCRITYATTHDEQGMSRSPDSEDNESHDDYNQWLHEGDIISP